VTADEVPDPHADRDQVGVEIEGMGRLVDRCRVIDP
jgi:hypothetical protein